MGIVLENDELANSDNNLTSEFGRNEGQGSWDSEEAENDQETFDTESTTPDSPETLNDTEPDSPEEYQAAKDDEEENAEENAEDDDTEEQEDDEQKNTPQDSVRRVLSYSDYFSSND